MYDVIVCYNCGRLILTKKNQKTRGCPLCGIRLVVSKAKVLASAKTAQEASKLIQVLKQRREVSRKSV